MYHFASRTNLASADFCIASAPPCLRSAVSPSFRRASASNFVSGAALLVAVHRRYFSGEVVITSCLRRTHAYHFGSWTCCFIANPLRFNLWKRRFRSVRSYCMWKIGSASMHYEDRIIEGAGMQYCWRSCATSPPRWANTENSPPRHSIFKLIIFFLGAAFLLKILASVIE